MMRSNSLFVVPTLCLLLLLGLQVLPGSARGNEHAVTIMAASPAALEELGKQVPPQVERQLQGMLSELAGPLAIAISPDAPLGVWLDWNGVLPSPIVFLQHADVTAFRQKLNEAGVKSSELASGIVEVEIGPKLYFRHAGEWFLAGTSEKELLNLRPPTAIEFPSADDELLIQVDLKKIPEDTLNEIAEVLSTRLLPPEVSLADENTANGLIKLYVRRFFTDVAKQGEAIAMAIDVRGENTEVNLSIDGANLRPASDAAATFDFPSANLCPTAASVFVDLRADEQAMLSWWAQSLPAQVEAALAAARVEDRSGEQAILDVTRKVVEVVTKAAQRGRLEAFVGLAGQEQDIPLVGIRTPENLTLVVNDLLKSRAFQDMGFAPVGSGEQFLPGVVLQQFSIEQDGVLGGIVTSDDAIYFTVGHSGLRKLKQLLQLPKPTTPPMPLGLRLPEVTLPTVFGWLEDSSENSSNLEVTSQYTSTGMQLRFTIGQ